MKNILIICVLVLFTACDSPAQSDPNPAKTRAISRDFGISSIPAMWLVDRKGFLASTHGGEDLAGQVEKLLKAP